MIGAAVVQSTRLFLQELVNHRNHRGTSAKMFGLIKRTISFAHHLSKVDKMDFGPEFTDHRQQVIIRSCSIRAHTESQAVGESIATREDRPCIIGSGHYSRYPE